MCNYLKNTRNIFFSLEKRQKILRLYRTTLRIRRKISIFDKRLLDRCGAVKRCHAWKTRDSQSNATWALAHAGSNLIEDEKVRNYLVSRHNRLCRLLLPYLKKGRLILINKTTYSEMSVAELP